VENKDYLTFTHPNCCDPALTVIERCYEGNANFLKVTVPGVGSSMVFEKATLIVSKADNCNDTGCGLPFKGTAESPFLGYILLIGKMFYVAEAATGLSNNRMKNTLQVQFNNTTLDGNSYATTSELYDAIMAVVADCDCTCSDVVMPCESIVSDLTWEGEEDYQLIFHVGTSIGETIQLEVFNEEEVIAYTSEEVNIEEGATIVLPGESLSAISPGNTFRFYVRNGNTECFSDVPVVVGGEAIANNEEEIEVDLEDYFTAAVGACAGVAEYLLFYGTYTPGAAIVDGVLVIQPDETDPEDEIIGNLGLARICDGVLDSIVLVNIGYEEIIRPEGFRIVYNDIANVPGAITDPAVVAQWNSLLDLPTNGTAFSSVEVYGNEVVLVGGAGITLKENLFLLDTDIVLLEDRAGVIVAAANGVCNGCTSITTLIFPEMLTAGNTCFNNNSSVTALSFPKLTTTGSGCFNSLTSVTALSFPLLVTAGALCFLGCSSTTTLTFPELTSAGTQCFSDLTSVTSISFPELVSAEFGCFYGMVLNTSFSFPSLTSCGDQCFDTCSAATLFNLPLCAALGTSSGDNNVFANITLNTITVNVPVSLQTANGGSPDGDLVEIAANNTATINYI